jgi:hypothetical protein
MRLLAGFVGAVGALLALFGAFVVRVRLYDSTGEFKGVGNIGTGPPCLVGLGVALVVLACVVWSRSKE